MLAVTPFLRLIYLMSVVVFVIKFQITLVKSQEEEAQGSIIVSFIYGLGIPWDVQGGYMTTGYAVRVPYAFPMKIKEWRTPYEAYFKKRRSTKERTNNSTLQRTQTDMLDPTVLMDKFQRNKKRSPMDMGTYRWAIYQAMEVHATRLGYDGRACMLRGICEAATVSFNWKSGLLGELLHILLTPSTTKDSITKHSDYEYHHAEHLGKSGAPCERIFRECKKSLLDEFSSIYADNLKFKM